MTDRELLEFAAKAAGIDAEFHPELGYGPEGMWLKGKRSPDNSKYWNPLTDDGDALRLASCLVMDVKVRLKTVVAWAAGGADVVEGYTDKPGSRIAATRRAITRAAASIGEKMP